MTGLTFPFRYLTLRTAKRWPLPVRDLIPTMILIIILATPFVVFDTTNYFHKDGFIDKLGSFSSVLTGFYVAGLVAVATFSHQLGDLDEVIKNGPIIRKGKKGEEDIHLTRREYVCQMFGYLATLSLIITLTSIVVVILAQSLNLPSDWTMPLTTFRVEKDIMRAVAIAAMSAPVAHLVVTTTHSLYYLIDRIYDKKPIIKPKGNSSD